MSEEEDKTRIVRRPLQNLQGPALPDPPDVDETRRVDRGHEDSRRVRAPLPDDGKTKLFRPTPNKPTANKPAQEKILDPAAPAYHDETVADPVVGWLVIVKGPGRGKALALGYGFHTIGRDPGQRVRLDFGDLQISRQNHAKLLYDARARRFSMTLAEGINPTYIRGEALLAPTEIKSGDRILMGETELLFVALCGESFEWSDNA